MRIIRHGRDYPEWKKRLECTGSKTANRAGQSGCGALLEVERADLFMHEAVIGFPQVQSPCFLCPCCCTITPVNETFRGLPNFEQWKELTRPPYR